MDYMYFQKHFVPFNVHFEVNSTYFVKKELPLKNTVKGLHFKKKKFVSSQDTP